MRSTTLALLALCACAVSSPPTASTAPSPTTTPTTTSAAPRAPIVRTAAAPRPKASAASSRVRKGTAILYVSQWCMHCEPVRDQLREQGVPFVERDIFDERHRPEYAAKMQSIGRRPPAVPLVDLDGALVLGLDNTSIHTLVRDHRAGRKAVQERAGATTPPTIYANDHTPGGTPLAEPRDAPAILYVSSDDCPHCKPARAFLRSRGIDFVERDIVKPAAAQQLETMILDFHIANDRTVPSFEVFGRGLRGFDDDGIDAILEWRRRVARDRAQR